MFPFGITGAISILGWSSRGSYISIRSSRSLNLCNTSLTDGRLYVTRSLERTLEQYCVPGCHLGRSLVRGMWG